MKKTDDRSNIRTFRTSVLKHWREYGRHDLPWRQTNDPYKILVSEVMLQQTQVHRVVPKYKEFLKTFPTVRHLARSHLADVLRAWSGLGYNRRAKFLRDAAVQIVEKLGGKIPRDYETLRALPGIGDYTARAIRVFVFNEPDILIETNIRTAFIHHFYSSILQNTAIADADIFALASQTGEGQDPREWHWALMDYGAYLKRSGVRTNHRSAHYAKQSKFEGSLRQVRGQVLRNLMKGAKGKKGEKWVEALASLVQDGLVVEQKGSTRGGSALGRKWRIA
ncbi:A/G-specific adenine glycosylase [Candidatus Kaiserbacteria bacterium]|nr:A/G-specific adenine glycosylase [Candidatus Kaiserbacteria bacterium]